MKRPIKRWFIAAAVASTLGVSPAVFAEAQVSLDQAIEAFDALDAESERVEVWTCLDQLNKATEQLADYKPARTDPQQAVLDDLAEDHLSDLVNAYGKFNALRFYLLPLVEEEILRNGGPNLSRIHAIELPENATESQAWVFIRDIVRASEGQRRISSADPQADKLAMLCDDHMPLLIQALDIPRIRYYVSVAIREHASEEHKQVIIDALLQQQELISIIDRRGWAKDAKAELVKGLEQGVDYSSRTWVQCLARLEDPETYDTLALQLYRDRCSRSTYGLIKDLPGIEVRQVVFAAWEEVNNSPTHARELRELSQIAVQHGHPEALAHLISLLNDGPPTHRSRVSEIRRSILDYVDFEGSDEQLQIWFEKNREALRFSPTQRRFYIAGGLS